MTSKNKHRRRRRVLEEQEEVQQEEEVLGLVGSCSPAPSLNLMKGDEHRRPLLVLMLTLRAPEPQSDDAPPRSSLSSPVSSTGAHSCSWRRHFSLNGSFFTSLQIVKKKCIECSIGTLFPAQSTASHWGGVWSPAIRWCGGGSGRGGWMSVEGRRSGGWMGRRGVEGEEQLWCDTSSAVGGAQRRSEWAGR